MSILLIITNHIKIIIFLCEESVNAGIAFYPSNSIEIFSQLSIHSSSSFSYAVRFAVNSFNFAEFTAFSGFFYDTFFDAEDLSFRDFGSVGTVGAGFGDFTAEKHGVGSFASVI